MKTLKFYNIIAIIIIILLVFWVVELRNELTETREVLEQCSDRYYEVIDKAEQPSSGFSEKNSKSRQTSEGGKCWNSF